MGCKKKTNLCSLNWEGKDTCLDCLQEPSEYEFIPCPEESVNFDTTENLFFECDNLDALKYLQQTHLNKIKCIYIDPPYNTGKKREYKDDFGDITGCKHSDWLNMMYPRLVLASKLLSEDGVIFISIDDNEQAQLKMLCDEVFGEENFQKKIIWRIGWVSGYKTKVKSFVRNHDVIFIYSKNNINFKFQKKYIENKDFRPLIKDKPELRLKLNELGLNRNQQKEMFDFINYKNRPERYPVEDTWNCNEYDDLNSINIVSFSGEKISKILNIDKDFEGQKPTKMVRRILEFTIQNCDVVLDYFAGSGTTAHATMKLNGEDGGRRNFILCQTPDPIDGEYSTIAEICKERMRRAGKKVLEEAKHKNIDVGFQVWKVKKKEVSNG